MTKDPARPALILLLLFCVGLLGEVDYQMIPPLLPLLASTFGITASHAARVVPVYSVASAVFSLLFGYLSDHYGRKRFIQAGLVCFSVTCAGAFASASFETFLLARLFSGVPRARLSRRHLVCCGLLQLRPARARYGDTLDRLLCGSHPGHPDRNCNRRSLGLAAALSYYSFGRSDLRPLGLEVHPGGDPAQVHAIDSQHRLSLSRIRQVFGLCLRRRDTLSILLASPLSSGAIVAFITFLSSHLITEQHVSVQQVGLVFLLCGLASLAGAPLQASWQTVGPRSRCWCSVDSFWRLVWQQCRSSHGVRRCLLSLR